MGADETVSVPFGPIEKRAIRLGGYRDWAGQVVSVMVERVCDRRAGAR